MTTSLHPTAMGVCVCVCVCVGMRTLVWISRPAAHVSVNQTWNLKDGECPPTTRWAACPTVILDQPVLSGNSDIGPVSCQSQQTQGCHGPSINCSHHHPPSSGAHSGAISLVWSCWESCHSGIHGNDLDSEVSSQEFTCSAFLELPTLFHLQGSSAHRHHMSIRYLALALDLMHASRESTCFVCGISSSFLGSFAYRIGFLAFIKEG